MIVAEVLAKISKHLLFMFIFLTILNFFKQQFKKPPFYLNENNLLLHLSMNFTPQ